MSKPMSVWLVGVVAGACVLAGGVVSGQEAAGRTGDLPPIASYVAQGTVDTIRIDGVLDEVSWALAPRVGPFRLIRGPQRPPAFPTEAAVTWDATNLYVAFACTDAEPWARHTARDERLWQEEVVEIFLDPDGDGRQYAEIEVSPTNVVVDLMIPAPRTGGGDTRRWNAAGMQTAVTRHAAGWIAEVAIPWASLAESGVTSAPKPGDQWRVGLYRIKRPGGVAKAARIDALVQERGAAAAGRKAEIDAELEALRADDEYAAWSVTHGALGFHDPERFGVVTFVAAPRH
ncbi:MAG: carbohydrate-binding family 9-like protein [Acidobacteria bacterium]|nr:carbohydrate-binding family 9-like protein [Acidobacteriota bacterium]